MVLSRLIHATFSFQKILKNCYKNFVVNYSRSNKKFFSYNLFGGGIKATINQSSMEGNNLPAGVQYFETPDKSESDKKLYRLIQLENGIRALLIEDTSPMPESDSSDEDDDESDGSSEGENEEESSSESEDDDEEEEAESTSTESETDEESSSDEDEGDEKLAAIALMVDVGSFSDPKDINGLAHFLEHMIFMGSEKYPSENEFDSYIKKCGGFDNAETECEETSFHFEISEEHLDEALDRFAALFISPLMKKEAMQRERDSIESEFQSTMQDDEMRRDELLASLGTPGHPSSIFTWGNLKTLKENIDDDELHRRVHEFRRRHYSAHRMYICIQARLSLDTLQDLVVKHFSQIPNNNLPPDDFSTFTHENSFKDEFYSNVYFVKPVSNICKLEITWCLPPLAKEYRYKPHDYLAYLLGYEGCGSLCAYLRRKLWALEMMAGVDDSGFEYNSMYCLFNICIYLTEEGFNHLNEVLEATFAYIQLLEKNGPNKDLFTELQEIEATTFRFHTERSAYDNVQDLVINLKYYPPKDILTGPELYFEYNEESIKRLIKILNTRKFNIMITSLKKYNGIAYDKKEKWFGTEYATIKMPQEWINLWDNCRSYEELYFPKENQFVTKDFQIFYKKNNGNNENDSIDENCEKLSPFPKKLLHNDICELWFRQDDKFLLPECYMNFYFISPLPLQNAKNTVLMTIYSLLVKYRLVEELYPASTAGLNYSFYASDKGLILKVTGYNEKLHLLVDVITRGMTNIAEKLSEDELKAFVKQQQVNYYNSFIKPRSLNKDLRLSIVEKVRWSMHHKYNLLKDITLTELKDFSSLILKQMKIQALIQGNYTEEKAHNVMNIVLNNLQCSKIEDMSLIESRTCQLPLGSNYIICKSFNENDVNTVISNLYQIGPCTIRNECMLDLLMMFAEEPLFDILRTKEQLAYDVSSSIRNNYGILGYTITVNSQENKFTSEYVEERIESFRSQMHQILLEMNDHDYEHVRESLIRIKLVADNELKDEVVRNWGEIVTEEYIFDRNKKEVECLRTITKAELTEFLENTEKENFRKLSIQVVGNKHASPEKRTADRNEIQSSYALSYITENKSTIFNIDEFKKDLIIYPSKKELFYTRNIEIIENVI